MILTDYFYPQHDISWDLAAQCGVGAGVIRLPEDDSFCLTDPACWDSLCGRFLAYGIRPLVLEPIPNCLHDHIKTGDAKRDESIEAFLKMLPIMRDHGIRTVCFNFMAHVGWLRTSASIPARGGALVTGFRLADYTPGDAAISEDALWENYRYFVDAAVPEAERCGVRLALHPDDPPLPRLGNVSRIMISLGNIQRALSVRPSPMLGVTFCQACYRMMGEDLERCARALNDRIFFIHFRNCEGCAEDFRETFHDDGCIDMARMIALYAELNLRDVPIRIDHVPTMGSVSPDHADSLPAGYGAMGRPFAIGYLKGLLEMYDHLHSA